MRDLPRLSLRHDAGKLLLYVLVSFGASVVLTRAYLEMADYPRIEGGNLHLAHLLWGGLAMAVAGIVLLIFATPRVHTISAVLVGLGIGLFIDEVGKFITIDNDYFYRPAAPIIYVCFLLVALMYYAVQSRRGSEESKLIAALEQAQALVEAPVAEEAHEELSLWLNELRHSRDPARAQLAAALAVYAESQNRRVTLLSRVQLRLRQWQHGVQSMFERHFQRVTVAVFVLIILRIVVGTFILAAALFWENPPDGVEIILPDNRIGVVLESVTSALLLFGLVLYFARQPRAGMFWMQTAMVLALTVVGVVSFYQEQFVAAVNLAFDLVIWQVLRSYASRLHAAEVHAHATIVATAAVAARRLSTPQR